MANIENRIIHLTPPALPFPVEEFNRNTLLGREIVNAEPTLPDDHPQERPNPVIPYPFPVREPAPESIPATPIVVPNPDRVPQLPPVRVPVPAGR